MGKERMVSVCVRSDRKSCHLGKYMSVDELYCYKLCSSFNNRVDVG